MNESIHSIKRRIDSLSVESTRIIDLKILSDALLLKLDEILQHRDEASENKEKLPTLCE